MVENLYGNRPLAFQTKALSALPGAVSIDSRGILGFRVIFGVVICAGCVIVWVTALMCMWVVLCRESCVDLCRWQMTHVCHGKDVCVFGVIMYADCLSDCVDFYQGGCAGRFVRLAIGHVGVTVGPSNSPSVQSLSYDQ